jgi:hypothetical protein
MSDAGGVVSFDRLAACIGAAVPPMLQLQVQGTSWPRENYFPTALDLVTSTHVCVVCLSPATKYPVSVYTPTLQDKAISVV